MTLFDIVAYPIPRDDEHTYGQGNQGGGGGGEAGGPAGGNVNQTGGGSTDRGQPPVIIRKAQARE